MLDSFPLNRKVVRIRRAAGDVDELGNDVVSEDRSDVFVFGWWANSPTEPVEAGHPRVLVDASMVTGVGDFVAEDAVLFPDDEHHFEVVGPAQNYDANPWWAPNREVVNLRRVTG